MIGGCSGDSTVKSMHLWTDILTMNQDKQECFISRILMLHEIATKQGGRAKVPRLSLNEWNSVADQFCFLGHCLNYMAMKMDSHGNRMFNDALLTGILKRVVEGDYLSDADTALAALDPQFDVEETSMFKEHKPEEVDHVKQRVAHVDAQMTLLNQDARKAQFEADCLALARDLAQVGSIYQQVEKNDRGRRHEKVAHLRAQNVIGASIVNEFMLANLAVHSGVVKDQLEIVTQFLQRFPDLPCIIWCDLMKCGRMTATEMDEFTTVINHVLHTRYKASAAVVIAPFLVSEKHQGYRGQAWEAKFDAKSFFSQNIAVRCGPPPAKSDKARDDNCFNSCQLLLDRATRGEVPWPAESSYVVPVAERDSLPHASEGPRSLSEVQEVAQFLSGEALPRIVLGSVLQKSSAGSSGSTVGIINLTPYDAWLEKTCHKGFDGITFKTVSLSKSLPTTQYVEKTLALDLLEEWKSGKSSNFASARPYEKEPPPPPPGHGEVDPTAYPMRLVKLDFDVNPSKKGWDKIKLSIPPATRGRYGKGNAAEMQAAFIAKQEKDAPPPMKIVPWEEPSTIELLMDRYVIENKISGRSPGTTLILVNAKRRDGTLDQVGPDQQFKLFLAAHCNVTIDTNDFVIAHGSSKWVKSEKVAQLQLQNKKSHPGIFVHCHTLIACLHAVVP
ncbi:unnamed protein product [Durusdinium trenchii]|uniref:Uncharacterized protein n=1 Tax=Durusdinium trenchii TaxID=1381693 RepID=A0ABP0HK91_9DINO